MKRSRKIAALVAALLLSTVLIAPGAFAQSSQDGYIQQGPSIIDQTSGDGNGGDPPGSDPPGSSNVGSGELPFTGLDLGLVGVAGGSLLLLGFGMRRLTRAPDTP